jgi:C-terminal processing protease CtpA/Prc
MWMVGKGFSAGMNMTTIPLHRRYAFVLIGAAALTLAACVGTGGLSTPRLGASGGPGSAAAPAQVGLMRTRVDMNSLQEQRQLMNDLMSSPDLPAWHDERTKLAMARGDRVFDKSFSEVFEGMVTALATLGSRVNNMDHASGYITASLPDLGPERTQELQKEQLAEYAKIKGYPDSVLQQTTYGMPLNLTQNMFARMGGSGLTLTMVRQSADKTKVKLRFDNVYFPKTEDELYRNVWAAVDKQMFLDKALDH